MNNIAIIGAGASGLLCSIILSRAGFNVSVFEKNTKIGRKILATGNGKCNISNENISSNNFYSNDKNFIEYPLKQFDYKKFKKFFEELGLDLISNEDGKVYPQTQQASSVVDLLVYEAKRFGVEFILDTKIGKVSFIENEFIVEPINMTKKFSKVIVSSGTKAMPRLGSCDSGFGFAKSFGHNIIEPFASLVQLCSDNKDIKYLSGVKVGAKVDLMVDNQSTISANGDLLFTDYGLSGNAILNISREASYFLSIHSLVTVKVDLFSNMNKEVLVSKLTNRLKNSNDKDKYFWLEGFINKKLAKFIVDNCGIKKDKQKANEINKKDIVSLVYFMKNMKVKISSTKGFDTAEVSAGGVDVLQVDSKTMQSKLQKGLYFTGEVLDVDGQCGGYNLHWAWASAYVCGNSIMSSSEQQA